MRRAKIRRRNPPLQTSSFSWRHSLVTARSRATKQSRIWVPELDCFAGARNDAAFSRRACARVLFTNATIAGLPKTRGRRSAERRIQPLSAPHHQMSPPEGASGAEAAQCRGRSPHGAPRRRLPKRPNASTQPRPRFARTRGRGRYPRRRSRLSGAPRAPVVVPEGTMPEPPGRECELSRRQITNSSQ